MITRKYGCSHSLLTFLFLSFVTTHNNTFQVSFSHSWLLLVHLGTAYIGTLDLTQEYLFLRWFRLHDINLNSNRLYICTNSMHWDVLLQSMFSWIEWQLNLLVTPFSTRKKKYRRGRCRHFVIPSHVCLHLHTLIQLWSPVKHVLSKVYWERNVSIYWVLLTLLNDRNHRNRLVECHVGEVAIRGCERACCPSVDCFNPWNNFHISDVFL